LNEPPDHPQPSQQELEDRALANRPALAATRARHRASEETLRAETAARWPWIRFSAAPRIRRNEFFGATTDLVLGLDLILPILDTNRGHVESATSARDVARADITATIEGLRVDIGRSLATITAQTAMLRQLQAEIAPLLAEHDRVLEAALRAMELDLPSLIASENLVLASRIELVNARLELRKAWLALERTVGTRLLPPAQKSQPP
jgi:outer membrane protein TolC